MTTNAEYQAAFKAKMRKQGLAAVTDWVPKAERETFKAYAKRLREGTATALADDPAPKPTLYGEDEDQILDALTRIGERITAEGKLLDDSEFGITVADLLTEAVSAVVGEGRFEVQTTLEVVRHRIDVAIDDYIEFYGLDKPNTAWLDGLKARIAKVEAAEGPRKYAAFNGCVNDTGQVHVDEQQIGFVNVNTEWWTAYQGLQTVGNGPIGSKSKPKAAYLVAKATVEYLTGKSNSA